MNYPSDPGKRFDSDYHRRVVSFLPLYTDDYGWSVPALFARMYTDSSTNFESTEELQTLLEELESQGHVERHNVDGKDIWRQSQQGTETASLGIPESDESLKGPVQPAVLEGLVAAGGATPIGSANPQPQQEQPQPQAAPDAPAAPQEGQNAGA